MNSKETNWFSVKEKLPKKPTGNRDYTLDGERIAAEEYIVTIKGASVSTSLYWTGKDWYEMYRGELKDSYEVTAWQPFPEVYKGE